MRQVSENTTIIVAGSFNPSILSPSWVGQHGLGYDPNKEFQVEFLGPVSGFGAAPRFSFDRFSYSPNFQSVTVHLAGLPADICQRNAQVVRKILQQLPHTPVTGVGINFSFKSDHAGETFLALFPNSDAQLATFDQDVTIVRRVWGNEIEWGRCLMRTTCSLNAAEGRADFNFHYTTTNALDAASVLQEPTVFALHRERAVSAANALFGEPYEGEA